nr:hypothetical protein [Tanacetum cinerariifolium]GEZ01272.1 hypothetical protein [Tanacetum cinerariifolium]
MEYFREMLHICPRIPNQTFDELLFEEEILAFLRYLGHIEEIKNITNVNINKLHQPWGSFAAVINKCLSGKSTGYNILRDDQMFTTIKLVLRHQNTQQTHISQACGSGTDEGTGSIPGVLDVPTDESDEEMSWKSSDEDDNDDVDDQMENSDDESNDDEIHGMNVGGEEGPDAENDEEELYRDVNINLEGRDVQMIDTTHMVDVPVSTTVVPLLVTAPTLPPPFIPIMSQFAGAVSSILGIVDRYIDHRMNEAVKIIKEQVKVQVSKILPKIEKTVNEQLEAEVLTRSSNSSKTSYVVAADLSELELKNILIKKMESNKSIHRSDEQMSLYKALIDAYECNKLILDTYEDTITLKRRRDDVDKDEEPSVGLDRGSKRRRSHQKTTSESAPVEEPMQTTQDLEKPSHKEFEIGRRVIPFEHFINNDLEYLRGGALSQKYTTYVTKTKAADYGHIKWIEYLDYKHLDWITVRKDDDKLYKFKEGDFKRLCIQDIEDMLLLLVQGKLTNLTVEERFAFNVSLRMLTRSIVIQQRVEDLQLGVKSYQKKLNLTKTDTYMTDLKHKEAYIAYSNLRGFIYQNTDKHNRLMRIDELHKFSNGTLNDV